jgi:hypothetical protein
MLSRPLSVRHAALLSSRSWPFSIPRNHIALRLPRCSYAQSAAATTSTSESPTSLSSEGTSENLIDQRNNPPKRQRHLKFGRNGRYGNEFSEKRANLAVNTLGQPAEVLIIRDLPREEDRIDEDVSPPSLVQQPEEDRIGLQTNGSSVNEEILASLDEENKAKAESKDDQQARIMDQVEALRPSKAPGVLQIVLSREEFQTLTKKLEGFTTSQLSQYYNWAYARAKSNRDASTDRSSRRVHWWPWQPEGLGETGQSKYRPKSWKKRQGKWYDFQNREHAVLIILRSLWEIAVQNEAGFAGHSIYLLSDIRFSTLSAGRKSLHFYYARISDFCRI